jgi:DNA-directed RNA polymerase specialized sigma24 family protein
MLDLHKLLPVAYRAAAQVLHNPLLAEEAGERALHKLTLALLGGEPPDHPIAWLRVVARRSACAMLRSDWTRTQSLGHEDLQQRPAPFRRPRANGADEVRERVTGALTPRQRDVFHAVLSCNSTSAAAHSCGMRPRDLRRHLQAITRKARAAFASDLPDDGFADDPGVQFRLPQ